MKFTLNFKLLTLTVASLLTYTSCTPHTEVTGDQGYSYNTLGYTPNTDGFHPMVVSISLDNSDPAKITDINVEHNETEGIYANNVEIYANNIITNQSLAIDAVSGCSYTFRGVVNGVAAGLDEAGIDPDDFDYASIEWPSSVALE